VDNITKRFLARFFRLLHAKSVDLLQSYSMNENGLDVIIYNEMQQGHTQR